LTWRGDEKVTKGFRGVLVSTDFLILPWHIYICLWYYIFVMPIP